MAYAKALAIALLVVAGVIVASYLIAPLWEVEQSPMSIHPGITVREFRDANGLSNRQMGYFYPGEDIKAILDQPMFKGKQFENMTVSQMSIWLSFVREDSKNWQKIVIKFALWLLFIGTAFFLLRKSLITAAYRKWFYLATTVIFGVILGADPSPMGTVKDAIVRLATRHDVFIPRLIAFGGFILLTIVANKFICSWGCQLGTLQDFLFRLGRDSADRKGAILQFKLPFALTNSVRVAFFAALSAAASIYAFDLVQWIDPFKVFNPAVLALSGAIFLELLLVASLFVYRPWCHLFCPFGLVGWLAEKVSIFRIRVDRQKCISCGKCAAVCPS
ncbi:MAG: 4Fe-4S dicluster domain-containing protein, partial [Candidatus Brocadiia bacterium]